jgi:hypothetical protein
MTTKLYQLRREGNGRVIEHENLTRQRAYQAIGQSIYDNGYASKEEAQKFAATVRDDGTPAIYGPYIFILRRLFHSA